MTPHSPNSKAFKNEVILEVAEQRQRENIREAEIEAAFREGYDEGYKNGQYDYGRFEWGGGSNRNTASDKDCAWRDSDCKARVENHARP